MRSLLGWVMVAIAIGACGDDGASEDADTGSVSASGSESGSASGPGSGTADDSTGSGGESGSATGSGTTGGAMSCYDATDVGACMAASGELETCLWLPANTVASGPASVCEPVTVDPSGTCVIDEASDGCGVFAEPSCPDEMTSVWFRVVGLEIGAVEVIAFAADSICEMPAGGFEPCEYDAATSTFTPPECECGCPMG
jgi:hypothetical protein